jgi:hypothetical protein
MNAEAFQQQLLEQQQAMLQLQQQLQLLQQQATAQQEFTQQSIESVVSSIQKPAKAFTSAAKAAKPSIFTGHIRANAELWLFEIQSYLDISRVPFEERVQLVGSYLKESAGLWYKYAYEESIAIRSPLTWEEFRSKFLARFRPIESGKTARVALASLRQTHSVQQYCSLFQQYVTLTPDMAETDKVFAFQNGLKPNIAREVDVRDPQNLTQAMNFAIRADARNSLLFRNSMHYASNNNNHKMIVSRPIPMDVDNVNFELPENDYSDELPALNATYAQRSSEGHSSQSKRVDISAADRERCMKERRCFNCKKLGHSSRNCRGTYSKNF